MIPSMFPVKHRVPAVGPNETDRRFLSLSGPLRRFPFIGNGDSTRSAAGGPPESTVDGDRSKTGRVDQVPVIDVGVLRDASADADALDACVRAIDAACRQVGFFLVVGHGIDPTLLTRLDAAARAFFALPDAVKAEVAMARGGRAWRGWFPAGDELTAGRPDGKEGIYFGTDLGPDDPRVVARLPLHGENLFPAEPPELAGLVIEWMTTVTELGQTVLGGMALALGLERDWFARHLTADPTVLFRIFRYPSSDVPADGWGVGEHTDYGLITLLAHDGTPGLEVRPRGSDEWVDVPSVPGAFVVNLGDMCEAMTAGRYRSTPHRVRVPDPGEAPSDGRLSFPLFLDPDFTAPVELLPIPDAVAPAHDDAHRRWDGIDLTTIGGTYGDYLVAKVSRVFPPLARDHV